ncbi:hypothetical protein VNO80_04596 [Phaseolus coccineus]|uniref:Uncharacterized protein n=1 Tax=Phaseolus coccineus TaxID=3886 RepID=A0AAN9RRX4_PHACN
MQLLSSIQRMRWHKRGSYALTYICECPTTKAIGHPFSFQGQITKVKQRDHRSKKPMSTLTFARKKSISDGIVIRVFDGDWRIPHYVIEFLLKAIACLFVLTFCELPRPKPCPNSAIQLDI